MKFVCSLLCIVFLLNACQNRSELSEDDHQSYQKLTLEFEKASKIFALPAHCLTIEYPNKLGQTIGSESDLKTPKQLRPVFYGCFDWHSSVHGYWSLVILMQKYPNLDAGGKVRNLINQQLTKENIAIEQAFFNDVNNKNFERTYGWAWLFKLQEALNQWDDEDAKRWAENLQPLTDLLIERYFEYLPKLNYPIRTGTHDNSAFGLSLSLDYAHSSENKAFEKLIKEHTIRLFSSDRDCPLNYEPSGHDFLSSCLEEAHLMSKVYNKREYETWLSGFLPKLFQKNFVLNPGKVSDRTDGHLVHLDGLNFSRAACLYGIYKKLPELSHLIPIAESHFSYSFPGITTEDNYMGSHWLGTFALYALDSYK